MGSTSPHNLEEHFRLVTLLALAVAFAEDGTANEDDTGVQKTSDPVALPSLADFRDGDREQLQSLVMAYAAALPEEQSRWLTQTIGKVRTETRKETGRLDEHIHPSYVIEVLREEPPYLQSFVVGHLPRACAEPVAIALGVPLETDGRNTGHLCTPSAMEHELAGEMLKSEAHSYRGHPAQDTAVAVVRRRFLSRFVSLDSLDTVAHLDLLSGRALAQLVRLLGVREAAILSMNGDRL